MDLLAFVNQLRLDGTLTAIATDPTAQLGRGTRQYLGPSVLPERMVNSETVTDSSIRFRTAIANDGTRYSPAQKKDTGEMIGSQTATLGHQDIKAEFSGRDYDGVLELINGSQAITDAPSMEAAALLIRWLDRTVNQALVDLIEKQRWNAIVDSQVVRLGDNGYTETVTYTNPTGHRAAAGGTWSSNAYDPWNDIVAMVQKLADKGYTCNRIITSRKVLNILARNEKVTRRTGTLRVVSATEIYAGRTTLGDINGAMAADGMPAFEMYELQYMDQAGSYRFLADNVVVFMSTTGRDDTLYVGSETGQVFPDTAGYVAVGRAVGQQRPGRVLKLFPHEDKPPRLVAEGWQASLPLLLEPESICVISGIA